MVVEQNLHPGDVPAGARGHVSHRRGAAGRDITCPNFCKKSVPGSVKRGWRKEAKGKERH